MNPAPELESDPRFPSGKWTGFFTDKRMPGKHPMDLILTFASNIMAGSGRDRVGTFTIEGAYQLVDGKCDWLKEYVGKHAVNYHGFNEGQGIWGAWELAHDGMTATGGFHIWPEGMPDPTQPVLREEADLPSEIQREELEPVGV
jgi:hypothetical protein